MDPKDEADDAVITWKTVLAEWYGKVARRAAQKKLPPDEEPLGTPPKPQNPSTAKS